ASRWAVSSRSTRSPRWSPGSRAPNAASPPARCSIFPAAAPLIEQSMTDPKRLSVNQICVLPQWTLRQAVEGLARHEVAAISVWREKLHEAGVAEGKRLIDGNGLGISGLCFAGLISSADRAAAATALDDVRRALDEAAAIGAPCLVFLSGGLDPNDK